MVSEKTRASARIPDVLRDVRRRYGFGWNRTVAGGPDRAGEETFPARRHGREP
jgi:hypothetical protein